MMSPKIVLLGTFIFMLGRMSHGQFSWQRRDAFDEIKSKVDRVTIDNCNIKHINELFLDKSTITHIPTVNDFNVNPIFPNRTALLHLHNMALSRSFYYSFILQRGGDEDEPGLMYYYLGTIADVAANPRINSSAIYFSPNMSYSPSYRGFFNKTMPLFGPRTFRSDDFNDPIHLQRVSTMNTFESSDSGAFRKDSNSLNYTRDEFRTNEWYKLWLPDQAKRQDSKTTYTVKITFLNESYTTYVFHGPRAADEPGGPVKWTKPYFDCGRSNKWSIATTVPIVDIFPRHTQFRHIEYPTYSAVSVMEMDFDRIDINQCPLGEGNLGPNVYAGTDKCKHDTTECEPLHGYGFRRGGYQCRCKPAHRLPNLQRLPYLGEIVERATAKEYSNNFGCKPVGYIMVMTQDKQKVDAYIRSKYIEPYYFPSAAGDQTYLSKVNIKPMLDFVRLNITAKNCAERRRRNPMHLFLGGDVAFGVSVQMENEARMALRLASFISAFLQVVDHDEQFAELRVPDKPFTEDQMMGEVLSIVMGSHRVWGSGVFWDYNKFTNRTTFAPYAYKTTANTRFFELDDLARFKGENSYLHKIWFKQLKQRWATNMDSLEEYILKIRIRANMYGDYSTKYDHYPIKYRGPNLSHGMWTTPYFDCDIHKKWVITYSTPFFGWDSIKNKIEFKGVVSVTTLLDDLDINQCTEDVKIPNAFKNTNKCDRRSSVCIPILGRMFDSGGYKCECEQGYEFPFDYPINYYDGQMMEAEFEDLVRDKPSRFDMYRCRLAGAGALESSIMLIVGLLSLIILCKL